MPDKLKRMVTRKKIKQPSPARGKQTMNRSMRRTMSMQRKDEVRGVRAVLVCAVLGA